MVSAKIDVTTGLPELPDGQVWRVCYSSNSLFEPPGWYVRIETVPSDPRWSDWMSPRRMIVGEDTLDTESREVPNGRTWYGKKLFRTEKRVLTRPQPIVLSATEIESWHDHPTAEEVRASAIALVKRIAKREAAERLIGVYPPNKLEVK